MHLKSCILHIYSIYKTSICTGVKDVYSTWENVVVELWATLPLPTSFQIWLPTLIIQKICIRFFLGSYSNLLKLKPISIFILEISKTDVIGNYYYFCFLCGNIKIPIDQPSFSISRNRFLFSEKWKQFTILVNSVNPTRDVERGIACNQRPLNYMDWLCK
jgi:hypothetical protein